MFDTSIVRTAAAPRRYGLFTASIILHSAVIAAAITASIASTQFPSQAPDQIAMFRPILIPVIPPPLGRPDAPRREPQVNPQPAKPQVAGPQAITAPPDVPNTIPSVGPPPTGGPGIATSQPGTGETGFGRPDGVPGGVGEVDTKPHAVPYTPGGEVRPARVLRRVEPRYPSAMIAARLKDVTVTVHCTIDKDGRIRDAQVARSSFGPFNDSVLEAVRQWTFAPGTLRGEPVDTYFELTVRFQMR
jgi:TonB family protein